MIGDYFSVFSVFSVAAIICSAGSVFVFAAIRAAAHVICPDTIFFADFQPIFLIL